MKQAAQDKTVHDKTVQGFTLVELAIALMVIGLLIGGVLKGQELIDNARVTATIRQVKAYDAATMIFRNTYGALPGDIKRPNRIPNCTADLCNVGGNGNGKVDYDGNLGYGYAEIYNFFPHLTKAGMIQGPEGGTQSEADNASNADLFLPTALDLYVAATPANFYNDATFANHTSKSSYEIPSEYLFDGDVPKMSVKYMSQIDAKIDDGKPHSGDVQAFLLGSCPTKAQVNGTDENEYEADDTNNIDQCPLIIRTGW